MKYKSMSGKVRIASTSGHCILIGDEFKEVPEHMEPEARALGCVSKDVFDKIQGGTDNGGEMPKAITADERTEKVLSCMKEMAEDAEKNFTKDGVPNKKTLNGLCGFTVTIEEFNAGWMTVIEELDGE